MLVSCCGIFFKKRMLRVSNVIYVQHSEIPHFLPCRNCAAHTPAMLAGWVPFTGKLPHTTVGVTAITAKIFFP